MSLENHVKKYIKTGNHTELSESWDGMIRGQWNEVSYNWNVVIINPFGYSVMFL